MSERAELNFEGLSCPVPLPEATLDRIVLGHGSGGRMSHNLIRRVFLADLDNPVLSQLNDGAVLSLPEEDGRLVLSTDAHVVQPLFFPGGDIGRLAVCGTVNDLAMMGARPLWLTAAFVLEEGFPIETLQRIVRSMREAAAEAGV
ncbi:MAG TPA: hydrogenase expression/formation protein HypE, partial [Caldilineae bacterium]|nr:hydrogenase expression/formation protein HypE [Caldilineae bacterium]